MFEERKISSGSCRIPAELVREFKGDIVFIGGSGGTGGIPMQEQFLTDKALMKKVLDDFAVILVPRKFMQKPP